MGKIRHIEIAGRDGAALCDFYTRLFGWNIRRKDIAGADYFDIETQGLPSAGIRHEPEGHAELVFYVEVADLEAAVEAAVSGGGQVRIPPMIHDGMRFALVEDPEGNAVGLIAA